VKPIVCYVTGREALGGEASTEKLLARIRVAITAGVDWVQIRERDLTARSLLEFTKAAVAEAGSKTRVIVNDRLDVALAAGAAGVHLRGDSVPASVAVRWLSETGAPANFLVGVSCHSREDATKAEAAGANYIFFGPVFDTPAKRKFGAPQGIAKLADVCRSVQIPVIAIGGIDKSNAAECLHAGAAGIAAIRMLQDKTEAALRAFVEQLHVENKTNEQIRR